MTRFLVPLVVLLAGCPSRAPQPGKSVAPPPAPSVVVRIEQTGPRAGVVWIGEERIGGLELDAEGRVRGKALILLPSRAKRFGGRPVEIRAPDALDPGVAQAVRTLLTRGGAGNAAVVQVGSTRKTGP